MLCSVYLPLQAPLSMEFLRQEYWSRLPFPTPQDLPHSGIEPMFLLSLVLGGEYFTTESPGKPKINDSSIKINVVSPHTGQNGQHQKKSTNNTCWR